MKLQKYQVVNFDGWASTITKKNHLDSMYPSNQQAVADYMVQLLSRQFGNCLETVLNQYPTKYFADDSEYFWKVIASARKNVPLVEARNYAGEVIDADYATNVGMNGEPFYLVFSEMWFFDGEEILGGLNQVYPMLIKGKPYQEGTNYVYMVELSNGSRNGVPVNRLLPGERFSYAFAPVERGLSKEVGGVRYSTPTTLRNEFTTIRIHDEVSGDVYGAKIAMGVPMTKRDASGKMVSDTSTKWMHYWEYEFELTWREYKNNLYAYSVSNRNENGEYMNFGKSGEVIRKGDGLYAQFERGNVAYYNVFHLPFLENFLLRISTSKLELNQREFLIRTGEWGMKDFSKEVAKAASGWTPYTYNGDALGVIKKNAGANSYTATNPQFMEYIGPNGLKVKVEVDSFYDDPVNNKIMFPNGEGTAMSHRFDIFSMGSGEIGKPNIFKVGIEGQPTEARSIQWGIRDPYTGRWGNQHMSFADDKAIIHKMGQFGVVVTDVTRVVSLIPAVLHE